MANGFDEDRVQRDKSGRFSKWISDVKEEAKLIKRTYTGKLTEADLKKVREKAANQYAKEVNKVAPPKRSASGVIVGTAQQVKQNIRAAGASLAPSAKAKDDKFKKAQATADAAAKAVTDYNKQLKKRETDRLKVLDQINPGHGMKPSKINTNVKAINIRQASKNPGKAAADAAKAYKKAHDANQRAIKDIHRQIKGKRK